MMTDLEVIYTADITARCKELDQRARLPSQEQINTVPDIFDQYRIQARKAQLHLEMVMELAKQEEEAAQATWQ